MTWEEYYTDHMRLSKWKAHMSARRMRAYLAGGPIPTFDLIGALEELQEERTAVLKQLQDAQLESDLSSNYHHDAVGKLQQDYFILQGLRSGLRKGR